MALSIYPGRNVESADILMLIPACLYSTFVILALDGWVCSVVTFSLLSGLQQS